MVFLGKFWNCLGYYSLEKSQHKCSCPLKNKRIILTKKVIDWFHPQIKSPTTQYSHIPMMGLYMDDFTHLSELSEKFSACIDFFQHIVSRGFWSYRTH